MKRIGLTLAFWAWLPLAAIAQVGGLSFPGPGPIAVTGGGNVNFTVTSSNQAILASPGTNQWTSVPIGTAASNRVVGICAANNGNGPILAGTINSGSGNIALTVAGLSGPTDGDSAAIEYATVPTGTTATITIPTTNTFPNAIGIAVFTITSSSSPGTPGDESTGFNADPQTTTPSTISVPSGGVGVLCGFGLPQASPTTTWGTFDANINNSTGTNNFQLLMAHISTSGTQAPSVSGFNFTGYGMTAVPFGP